MRALLYEGRGTWGGSRRMIWLLFRVLGEVLGSRCVLVCGSAGWLKARLDEEGAQYVWLEEGAAFHSLGHSVLHGSRGTLLVTLLRSIPHLLKVWVLVLRVRPSLVILCESRDLLLLWPALARRGARSVFVSGTEVEMRSRPSRLAIRAVDRVWAISEPVQDALIAAGVPRRKIDVLPPLVDEVSDRFARAHRFHLHRELGLDPRTPIVGIVGSIRPEKGQMIAVRALPAVLAANPEVRLVVVGVPMASHPEAERYLASVRQEVHDLHLADRALFLGWREDVLEVMCGLTVVLMPSEFEGRPFVALDALRLGVPIVGHDIPSLREVIVPGST